MVRFKNKCLCVRSSCHTSIHHVQFQPNVRSPTNNKEARTQHRARTFSTFSRVCTVRLVLPKFNEECIRCKPGLVAGIGDTFWVERNDVFGPEPVTVHRPDFQLEKTAESNLQFKTLDLSRADNENEWGSPVGKTKRNPKHSKNPCSSLIFMREFSICQNK